jgi:hypothetical protein
MADGKQIYKGSYYNKILHARHYRKARKSLISEVPLEIDIHLL